MIREIENVFVGLPGYIANRERMVKISGEGRITDKLLKYLED
jgi:hypothetical protein